MFPFSVCEPGKWGPGCERDCPCQNGATCDPVTGTCTCQPGYIGPLCDQACPRGKYGINCKDECRCQNGGRKFVKIC